MFGWNSSLIIFLGFRRMFAALEELRNASKLAQDICLGKERINGQHLEMLELVYQDY